MLLYNEDILDILDQSLVVRQDRGREYYNNQLGAYDLAPSRLFRYIEANLQILNNKIFPKKRD